MNVEVMEVTAQARVIELDLSEDGFHLKFTLSRRADEGELWSIEEDRGRYPRVRVEPCPDEEVIEIATEYGRRIIEFLRERSKITDPLDRLYARVTAFAADPGPNEGAS